MTQDGQGMGGHERLMTAGPLIVQSDRTVLLESDHPDAAEAAIAIAPFAQLSKTPEHVHTYTITPLGLWNARASGHDAESVVDVLLDYAKHPVPHSLLLTSSMSWTGGASSPSTSRRFTDWCSSRRTRSC